MADVNARRIVLIAALAGAVVGGAVAGGVAAASNNKTANADSSSGASTSVATTRVVRTSLQSTVQVGGSIGYETSYVIAAPSGATAQQLAQARQMVTQAQQALSTDQTSGSDTDRADAQAVATAQNNVTTATSALATDRAKAAGDCAGRAAASPACSQDTQKVSADESQLAQIQQQVTAAQLSSVRDHDQSQAKVQADANQLQAAVTDLGLLEPDAANPATTYTYLPKVGSIMREDEPVYALNGIPVPLLYGNVAAYRAFYVGMSDGADVGQLVHDLIDLGFGAGVTQSDHYSPAVAAAVGRWQTGLGLADTGSVLLGQVVFEPGPLRVTSVTPSIGESIGGNAATVLDATSTTPVVTLALDVTQEYLIKAGDPVTVVLPDGTSSVGGHVQSVGNVATCPNGNGNGTGNGSPDANSSADQSPCASSGSGDSSTPSITVTITLDRTPPAATLDQAPVNVDITTQRAENVLAVPVNALLALQSGGYGVDVVTGSTHDLVGVTTGLYSNTLVQITGSGITAGTLVAVPSS